MYFQQGDVKLHRLPCTIRGNQLQKTDTSEFEQGRCVVAEGEATGHAHVMEHVKFKRINGTLYLDVEQPTEITHEEHGAVVVEPGQYVYDPVIEYNHFEEEARQVRD